MTSSTLAPYVPAHGTVTMFTTPWCGYCRILKEGLKRAGIGFREVDIESDPADVAVVMAANGGNQTVPTVVFPDGTTETNPSANSVRRKLG